MGKLVEVTASVLGMSRREVLTLAENAPAKYRRYKVPKRNGGQRVIFHPARETKALQYSLMHVLLRYLPVNRIAVAYREGLRSPLRRCAERHASRRYTVCLDFHDFFPSIEPKDLLSTVNATLGKSALDAQDKDFLVKALFVEFRSRWFLAIGAPSSPMISNAVMYRLDSRFFARAYGVVEDAIVTRYADDLCFSTNTKGACNEYVKTVRKTLNYTKIPNLKLNEKKTKFASTGSSRHILGLTVTPDGQVSIGRNKKRETKALVHRFILGKTTEEEAQYLNGYLSYCADVEPSFIDSLALKYGSDVFRNLGGGQ